MDQIESKYTLIENPLDTCNYEEKKLKYVTLVNKGNNFFIDDRCVVKVQF
jgi:hypothetical protein